MTRPVYEPSTQRQIASQGYADRQLLRRPAPTAEATGSTRPWVVLEAGGQDFTFDTDVTMTTRDLYWDPLLVTLNPADPTDGSDVMFQIGTDTFDGLPYWTVSNRLEGWFTVEWVATFNDYDDDSANDVASWFTAIFPTPNFGGGFTQDRCCPLYLSQDLKTAAEATGTGEFNAARGELMGYRTIWVGEDRLWEFYSHAYVGAGGPGSVAGHMKIWWEKDAFGGDPDNNNWENAFAT